MLDLTATYPGQVVTTDPNFPQGRPRNAVTPGDGTGTPWEEQLAQDLVGAMQAIVAAGGVTPSGDPDQVGASDVLAAIRAVAIQQMNSVYGGARFTVSATTLPLNGVMTLTQDFASTGYSVASNLVSVPRNGIYMVSASMGLRETVDASAGFLVGFTALRGSTEIFQAVGSRARASTSDVTYVSGSHLVQITNYTTQTIRLLAGIGSGSSTSTVSIGGVTDKLSIHLVRPE